jgi:hypothetical protein
MSESETISDYINKVLNFAQQLQEIAAPVTEEDIVMTILAGLTEKYQYIIPVLENIPDLKLEIVRAKLIHEETKQTNKQESQDLLFTRRQQNEKHHSRSRSQRSHSDSKQNENQREKPRYSNNNKRHFRQCSICKKKGHTEDKCWFRNKQQANTSSKQLFSCTTNESDHQKWILDSGASQHMSNKREWFTEFQQLNEPLKIYLGNNSVINATGKGQVKVITEYDGKQTKATLCNVLYVPDLAKNLFSVSQATQHGVSFEFSKNACYLKNDRNEIITIAKKRKDIYTFWISHASR